MIARRNVIGFVYVNEFIRLPEIEVSPFLGTASKGTSELLCYEGQQKSGSVYLLRHL